MFSAKLKTRKIIIQLVWPYFQADESRILSETSLIINSMHCIKYARILVFTDCRYCLYTGENGSVKTCILAYFTQ